jgi:hypothetical protein
MIAFSFSYTQIYMRRAEKRRITLSQSHRTLQTCLVLRTEFAACQTYGRPELVSGSRIFGKVCGYLGKILTRKAVKVLTHNSISVLSWGQFHLFSTLALDGVRSSRSLLDRQPVWLVLSEKFQSARDRTPVSQLVLSYFLDISHP